VDFSQTVNEFIVTVAVQNCQLLLYLFRIQKYLKSGVDESKSRTTGKANETILKGSLMGLNLF
jgi:hypothetical protein